MVKNMGKIVNLVSMFLEDTVKSDDWKDVQITDRLIRDVILNFIIGFAYIWYFIVLF